MSPRKSNQPGDEQSVNQTGSLKPGEPVYLEVGRLRRPHGIRGEIVFEVLSDGMEYFEEGKTLLIGRPKTPMEIATVRDHDKMLLIKFFGLDTPDAASQYSNQLAYIPTAEVPPLPEGQYYFFQLIGLTAFDPDGTRLGILAEIIQTGAVPVYVVVGEDGSELLMPAIPEVVKKVDLEGHTITLKPQEWD